MNMKPLVIITGAPAVGKMTVGLQLSQLTGMKLFHNHHIIDPVMSVFEHGSPAFCKLVPEFRARVIEEAVYCDSVPGLIFTYVVDYKCKNGLDDVRRYASIFEKHGHPVFMIQLVSSLKTRLIRNRGTLRMQEKHSKRDIRVSEAVLLNNEKAWKMVAPDGFSFGNRFLSINNENLSPDSVAEIIIDHCQLDGLVKEAV